jgi:hypothetical protein
LRAADSVGCDRMAGLSVLLCPAANSAVASYVVFALVGKVSITNRYSV